jgi:hypothetical protein
MHLPERWGYLRFVGSDGAADGPAKDPRWPVIDALRHVYEAEQAYRALYAVDGAYTNSVRSLRQNARLPQYVEEGRGAGKPVITIGEGPSFEAEVDDLERPGCVGRINHERRIWFVC